MNSPDQSHADTLQVRGRRVNTGTDGTQRGHKSDGRHKLFVIAIAAVFIGVGCLLGALVADSIYDITVKSDSIDDMRALNAAASAVSAMKKQMEGTIRDNAFWDDAYAQVNSGTRNDWIVETWGRTTGNYPLYDTAIVIDATGNSIMAYEHGMPMESPVRDHFGNGLDALIAGARASNDVPVAFIRHDDGVVLTGAALIRPYETQTPLDNAKLFVLLFAKHLTNDVVAEMARDFSLTGLTFEQSPDMSRLNIALADVEARPAGYFAWPRQLPGSKSLAAAKPQLRLAGLILALSLAGLGLVGFMTMRNLKAGEIASHYKATHDPLSGLWNRRGLLENLDRESDYVRDHGMIVQVALIDLDGFKAVNDAWGHGVGDHLIVAVANRLLDGMPQGAIIGRFGGDEFAVILAGSGPALDSADLPGRIQKCLAGVFDIDGRIIEIGASIGLANSPCGLIEASEQIRQADLALYRAKDSGGGTSMLFQRQFDEEAKHLAGLEGDLRKALARSEIEIVFQPLFHADGSGIRGVEALARWQSSSGTVIGPDIFIPLAERSGLIEILGQQILAKAMAAAARWPNVGLSVNVSPLQLKNPRFVDLILDELSKSSFDASRLTIEITEGVLISNPEQARRMIAALKTAGIKVALDDFGCGFASIGTLRKFGFDRMKVDRSLIVALGVEANAGKVLQATIALANALDIPVTAEGIETHEQAEIVAMSGCDEVQGYLFSRPLGADQLMLTYFSTTADDGSASLFNSKRATG